MTDLTDFKRIVHEPLVRKLRADLRLERERAERLEDEAATAKLSRAEAVERFQAAEAREVAVVAQRDAAARRANKFETYLRDIEAKAFTLSEARNHARRALGTGSVPPRSHIGTAALRDTSEAKDKAGKLGSAEAGQGKLSSAGEAQDE